MHENEHQERIDALTARIAELEAEIKEAKERPYYYALKHEAEIRMTNFSIGLTEEFCHDLSALTGDKDELREHLIHIISEGIANKVTEVANERDTRPHQFAAKADFIGLWKKAKDAPSV